MRIRLTLIALLFFGVATAQAAPLDATLPTTAPACLSEGSNGDTSCMLAALGTTTAEDHARNHRDLVRLFDWDAWNRLLLVMDFTRDRHGAAQLRIADVDGGGRNLVLPIGPRVWRAAVATARRYFRQAIDPPHKVPPPAKGIQPICVTMDGMFERAETVLDGRVVRMRNGDAATSDDCFDPIRGMGETLRALALDVAPFCAKIDLPDTAEQIRLCERLSGDRMAAAEVANRASRFAYWNCSTADKLADVAPIFAAAASLHIDGRAAVAGAAAPRAWQAFTCERDTYFYFAAFDATAGGAVAHGTVTHRRRESVTGGESKVFESHATFTQSWARGADGQFRVTDWTIDAFSPEIEQKAN
jgi:hypothetical protein